MRSIMRLGQGALLAKQEEKIKNDPAKLFQYKIWESMSRQIITVEEKIRQAISWCGYKDPGGISPELLLLFSRWQIVNDDIELLKKQPLKLTQREEIVSELYNYNFLREKHAKLNRYLLTIEKLGGTMYQSETNHALAKEINYWKKIILQPYDTDFGGLEACYVRDEIEYALMAIANIQKQKNKETNKFRLKDVKYQEFKEQIKNLDNQFLQLIQKDKKNGITHTYANAPKTFWWRR